MDDDRRSRRPIARPMAATTTAATGRGGRRARARDAALPRLRFIDGEEEDARAARDGADADDRDAREEKKNEVGRGEEEGEETGASGEREATGGGGGRAQGGVGHRAGVRGRRGRRDGIRSQENAKHTASVGSDPRASREGTAAVAEATRRADAGTEARRGGCENRASQTPETGEGGRRGGEVAGRTA